MIDQPSEEEISKAKENEEQKKYIKDKGYIEHGPPPPRFITVNPDQSPGSVE
jgi:hypothetical protein